MFECTAFCGRMSVEHIEPPGGVLAKIFYQTDSVCSTFLCVRFHFTMNQQKETDIMGKSHEKDVNPVHFVCKLDKSIYSVVASDIQSGDVIITDERIEHIKDHHPNDYETFIGYIPQIIESPDYIVASPKPHTAVVLKMIEENGEKFKVILRLRVEDDPAHYKHSIISFWRIGDTTWRKTLKNKVILYSRR